MDSDFIKSGLLFQSIAVLLLVFIIPLQITLQTPLMSMSSSMIISLQDRRVEWLTWTFSGLKYLDEAFLYSVIIPLIVNFSEPMRIPKMVMFLTLSMYLCNVLAMIFQEYRPFWYTKDIKGELCLNGYGNPSTHIMLASLVLTTLAIELFHKYKYRIVIYLVIISINLVISFAFLYLGENFPHQVLTSLFISFILVTFTFTFEKKLLKLANRSCYNYKKHRVFMVKWYIVGMLLIVLVLAFDSLILSYVVPDPKQIDYAVKHCPANYTPDGGKNVEGCACIFHLMAYVTGSLLLSNKLNMYWNITALWKRFLRFFLNMAACYSIFIGFGIF